MTQDKLSDRLGISRGYLNAILRGKKEPGLKLAKKISKETGIPVLKLKPNLNKILKEIFE